LLVLIKKFQTKSLSLVHFCDLEKHAFLPNLSKKKSLKVSLHILMCKEDGPMLLKLVQGGSVGKS
jgi:hypothetical protein